MEALIRDLLVSVYDPPRAAAPWRLEDLLLSAQVRYFSFGRRALAEALAASGGTRMRVLVPEFICRDLLSALAAASAKPLFYAVGPDLAPADPGSWPEAEAAIAVNYFGFAQDLKPFDAYCRARKAVLIEDNAHGLFSRDAEGKLLGSRGDLGFFSLRKTLPIPNGAALAFNRAGPWRPGAQSPFSSARSLRFRLKKAARAVARGLGPSRSLKALCAFRALRGLSNGSRLPAPDPEAERVLPLPALPSSVLAHAIAAADPAEEKRRRRALYEAVARGLSSSGMTPVFASLPEGTVPYGFPFRAAGESLARAKRLLAEWGIEPLPWPDLPDEVRPRAPAHYRDVWVAHFLW